MKHFIRLTLGILTVVILLIIFVLIIKFSSIIELISIWVGILLVCYGIGCIVLGMFSNDESVKSKTISDPYERPTARPPL